MPWKDRSVERLREELVLLSLAEGANASELCRRFGVSRKTLYKWRASFAASGFQGLEDKSRRPVHSPRKCSVEIEAAVVAVRLAHRAWGGRKICAFLKMQGVLEKVPSPSTATEILRRLSLLDGPGAGEPRDWQRFERDTPNELWQMDFKGHFALLSGRCHPLTLLDDHSRFALGVWACANEKGDTVRPLLQAAFRRYGMPLKVLCDNGGPWAARPGPSRLEAWLIRLGVRPVHGRPYHPQTQGKLERFHKTLKAEKLDGCSYADLNQVGRELERWRKVYNTLRPHESLDNAVPASRYQPSPRTFPEGTLPKFQYQETDLVRMVQQEGWISFLGKQVRVGDGLEGHAIALRMSSNDGVYELRFCHLLLAKVDVRADRATVTYVSEQV